MTTTNESREAMEPVESGWKPLPEDSVERAAFDRGVAAFDGNVRYAISFTLKMIAHAYEGTAVCDMCVIMANEVGKLRTAAQLATVEARVRELETRELNAAYRDDLMTQLQQARAEIAELESALAAAKLGGEWQPIETAPKDTYCLVTGGTNVYYGFFDGNRWMVENRGLIGNESDTTQSLWMRPSKETPPTHWMPLPQPPRSE